MNGFDLGGLIEEGRLRPADLPEEPSSLRLPKAIWTNLQVSTVEITSELKRAAAQPLEFKTDPRNLDKQNDPLATQSFQWGLASVKCFFLNLVFLDTGDVSTSQLHAR